MISPSEPVKQVNAYIQLSPLMFSLKNSNDSLLKNLLPENTLGTIQENTHLLPSVTLYNSHGILDSKNPNSLIAYT
jgi:hypothetical protein